MPNLRSRIQERVASKLRTKRSVPRNLAAETLQSAWSAIDVVVTATFVTCVRVTTVLASLATCIISTNVVPDLTSKLYIPGIIGFGALAEDY
jgi:hypothetical protein